MTQKNRNTFKIALEWIFKEEKTQSQGLHSYELTDLIQRALSECKRAKNKKSKTKCFPVNAWFDEECKKSRRTLKESNKKETDFKAYKRILRKKKVDFMLWWSEELIFLGKNNPKLFWKELQTKKKQTKNNTTAYQWFEYAKQLYEQDPKADPPLVNTATKLFTVQEVEVGIKKLGVGKAKELNSKQSI